MEKYRVRLATEERAMLEALLRKGKVAARKIAHSRILLLADDTHGAAPADDEIASVQVSQISRRIASGPEGEIPPGESIVK